MNEINNQLETELNEVSAALGLSEKRRFEGMREMSAKAADKAKAAARHTDECVHNHAWSSIGLAMGAGLLIGLLVGRKA